PGGDPGQPLLGLRALGEPPGRDVRAGVSLEAKWGPMGARPLVERLQLGTNKWLDHLGSDRRQPPGARLLLHHRLDPAPEIAGGKLLEYPPRLQGPAQLVPVETGFGRVPLLSGGSAQRRHVEGLELRRP